jgi:hypothetical protein
MMKPHFFIRHKQQFLGSGNIATCPSLCLLAATGHHEFHEDSYMSALYVWKWSRHACRVQWKIHTVESFHSVTFLPGRSLLLVTNPGRNAVHVFDAKTRARQKDMKLFDSPGSISAVGLPALVAVAMDASVCLFHELGPQRWVVLSKVQCSSELQFQFRHNIRLVHVKHALTIAGASFKCVSFVNVSDGSVHIIRHPFLADAYDIEKVSGCRNKWMVAHVMDHGVAFYDRTGDTFVKYNEIHIWNAASVTDVPGLGIIVRRMSTEFVVLSTRDQMRMAHMSNARVAWLSCLV